MAVYANFDQESLDREYAPSSCIDDINVYLEQYAAKSESARNTALVAGHCQLNLSYGPSAQQTLDLFVADAASEPPLHVFVHGGYWQQLSKEDSSFAAPVFLDNGAAFAAVNYTLAPHISLTGIVQEVRAAVAWLYGNAAELGFDREKIYVSGSSAGAHLATMLLQTDWACFDVPADVIRGLCAVSGVYDLVPVSLTAVNDKVGMDLLEARAMSPLLHEVNNRCPAILAYGENETAEFKRQTNDYLALLRGQNMSVVCKEIPGRNHFDVILDLADAGSWLSRMVLKQMGIEPAVGQT
ncbi:MAG: arylformamidase [Woeseiaceae bacterium]|jgi:arylformamidase